MMKNGDKLTLVLLLIVLVLSAVTLWRVQSCCKKESYRERYPASMCQAAQNCINTICPDPNTSAVCQAVNNAQIMACCQAQCQKTAGCAMDYDCSQLIEDIGTGAGCQ